MSAAQPKATEPSMEEILASIRRIISDEPQKTGSVAAPSAVSPQAGAPPAADPVDDDDVMDLTPRIRVKEPEPHFIADDPVDNDLSFVDTPPAPRAQNDIDALMSFDAPVSAKPETPVAVVTPPPAAPPPPLAPLAAETRLISNETDKAATSAFASLATTILSKNARTLEDLMQDMMRPMIKTWLDDNLPTVVERLVKAEIERVSRGGR